jgi:hypothetical protein
MKKINKVIHITQYYDQKKFEYIEYPELDFDTSKAKLIHSKFAEVEKIEKKIIYEDGSEFILPISEIMEVLPDRSGFMVIYGKTPSRFSKEKNDPWFFDRPNNAAIYNANGSLRCQIKNPWKDGYIFSFEQPSMKYPNLPSVILDYDGNPHDSSFYDLYAIDIKTGELLETRQQIRW